MKILNLHAENVKRIRAIDITPDGAIVEITGRNGQGKSSVLDAIVWAIGGKPGASKPVRDGEDRAEIVATIGDTEPELIVRRNWTNGGESSYLTIDKPDGSRIRSPQQVLDALFASLAFDPLEFTRQKPAAQAETLRALVGLDLAPFDGKRARVYEERRDIGRSVADAKGQLAGIPPAPDDLPASPIVTSEVLAARDDAGKKKREFHALQTQASDSQRTIDELNDLIARSQNRLMEEKSILAIRCRELEAVDIEAINATIEDAEQTIARADEINSQIREREHRAAVASRLAELNASYTAMSEEIEAIDKAKAAAIAAAKFPLEGLGIDDGIITLRGIPFDQLSQAEQIRASVAIAMSMNPKLRVGLVHDGSLLDDDSMRALAAAAEEHDFQIWIERVGTQGRVVIEDGSVVGAES